MTSIDSIFTTKFLVEPRYIIQHLVDKVFAFFKPLGRMKTAIAQLIYSSKPGKFYICMFPYRYPSPTEDRRYIGEHECGECSELSSFRH